MSRNSKHIPYKVTLARRERKRQLVMLYGPYCFWCRRRVRWYNTRQLKAPMPDDLMTLDHVQQQMQFEDDLPEDRAAVLACYRCNCDRAQGSAALRFAELDGAVRRLELRYG